MELSRRNFLNFPTLLLVSSLAYHPAAETYFRRDTYFTPLKTLKLPASLLRFLTTTGYPELGNYTYKLLKYGTEAACS